MFSMENVEKADGAVPADAWAMAIIRVACVLIVGIVILSGVVVGANITAESPFYALYTSVQQNIQSGYSLAALMLLALGSSAILHFLGFM